MWEEDTAETQGKTLLAPFLFSFTDSCSLHLINQKQKEKESLRARRPCTAGLGAHKSGRKALPAGQEGPSAPRDCATAPHRTPRTPFTQFTPTSVIEWGMWPGPWS